MKSAALVVPLCLLQLSSISSAASPKPQQINAGSPTSPAKTVQRLSCIPGSACKASPNPASLAFLLPVFLSNHDFKSTAILVNSSAVPTYVDVNVHDAGGNVAGQQRVNIAARNQVQIDIGELLDAAHSRATAGSVQITPATDGTGIGVIGQMSITYSGSSEPSYLEYEPSRPGPGNSLVLRAVADAGQGSPIVGITSVVASAQKVTIQCFGASGQAFSKIVSVPPWGTLVTPACNNAQGDPLDAERGGNEHLQNRDAHPQARGISLTTDAPPGSFAAIGLAPHHGEDGTFFTAVPFSDPKGAKTSTTVFPGLPVGSATLLPGGQYVPELSVANFSSSPAHVTVQYSQTTGGTPQVKTVANLTVPVGGAATTELKGLQGDPDLQNSFEIVSDQAPGDVVGNIASKSDTGIRWVELPGKDMDNSHNGGNHPWTVADGTDSTILLFNQTAAAENFTVRVDSGQAVWTKKYTVAPLATKAIDIDELIEDQVKDDHGSVLPKGLESGEANWLEARQFGGTGRLLQSNPSQYAARSFSCGEEGVIIGSDWYPYITSELAGQTNFLGELDAQVGLTEDFGCSGDYVGDSNDYEYSWGSENTSIATIPNYGDGPDVEGVSSGSAWIDGSVWDQYGCEAGVSAQETVTADQTPVIAGISPSTWTAGNTTSVTITGQYFGTDQPTLSYSDSTITTQGLSSYGDTQIVANVNVPSGTPNEDVEVSITNNGYGGNTFLGAPGGGGATSGAQQATISDPATCPSTVAVVSPPTSYTLAGTNGGADVPQPWLTGIGIVAGMQVGPNSTNWNGNMITESLTTQSNSCGTNFFANNSNPCQGNSTFKIGQAFTANAPAGNGYVKLGSFLAVQNQFYDIHVATSNANALAAAGLPSCSVVCSQSYSCGGSSVGSFTITYRFSTGTVNGSSVTNVGVTKQ